MKIKKSMINAMAIGLVATFASAAIAGDALDSVVKCANVKGGTKTEANAGRYSVYLRSEGNIRSGKVDIVTEVAPGSGARGAILRYPIPTVKLVNSWINLNQFKAWFMEYGADGKLVTDKDNVNDGKIVLYVKVEQKALENGGASSGDQLPEMIYKGSIEAKKSSGLQIFDEDVSCRCGTLNKGGDYSTWKQTTCTPNSKD